MNDKSTGGGLLIPPEKADAVLRGVSEAFGTTVIEDTRRLTKGLSADLIFRIVVQGTPFLLRIMARTDGRTDPSRMFAAMRLAAEAGLAPRVWYANVEDGISVTDFVEAAHFSTGDALVRVPATLRSLHALPRFAREFNYALIQSAFIDRLPSANLLPANEVDEAFREYGRVCAMYPRIDSDLVPSHNDLKPENVLFDGGRVVLVDWEAALTNDRYFDLSVVANFVVGDEAEERVYLHHYFGGDPPDEYQLARFFLMRQVVHMMYASVFLLLGAGRQPIDLREGVPAFVDFHRRIWSGEVTMESNPMRVVYGRVHWERLLTNLRLPRFEEALRIVSVRHTDAADRLLPATSG